MNMERRSLSARPAPRNYGAKRIRILKKIKIS